MFLLCLLTVLAGGILRMTESCKPGTTPAESGKGLINPVITDKLGGKDETEKGDSRDSLHGAILIKADGSKVEAERALENTDLVLLYFSALWCPPCTKFTSILTEFYREVSDELEIVFVWSDRTPEDMISYMKEYHGDWYGVEHNSSLARDLKQEYGVKGIPMVVVVRKDGTLITKYGRHHK